MPKPGLSNCLEVRRWLDVESRVVEDSSHDRAFPHWVSMMRRKSEVYRATGGQSQA